MVPDIYTHEKFALEHRLLREAEHERIPAEVQNASPHSLQRPAGRPGKYLIVVGTRLQRGQAVEYRIKSSS